jgi:hypothetical protein
MILLKKMEFLNVNETRQYNTNILNTELIRTGTEKNGSCFFYSIYLPFLSFRKLTDKERYDFIQDKRKILSEKMNIEKWFNLQNGNVAFLQITETMSKMIHSIPDILYKNEEYLKKYNINNLTLDILFTLMDPNTIEKEILPKWDIECSKMKNSSDFFDNIKSEWYNIYKDKITQKIADLEKKIDKNTEKMSEDHKKIVIQTLSMLSYPIFEFVTQYSLEEFKNDISNIHKWLNIFIFYSVLEYLDLNYNIIIIDNETGLPYEGMKLVLKENTFNNKNPFIVVLYFKDLHFESLGKKYIQNNKNYINRIFKKDDPFIITCLTYLGMNDE